MLTFVMIFHAGWITFDLLVPSAVNHLPSMGAAFHLLTPRQDIDGAICGLFVVLTVHRAFSGRAMVFNIAVAGWNTALLFSLKERAGLVAFAAEVLVFVWLYAYRHRSPMASRARGVGHVALLFVPVLAIIGSQTVAYQRVLAGFENYIPFIHVKITSQTGGAQSTTHARQQAWSDIVGWLGQSPVKEITGIGFGPNYLHDSGADVLLLGGDNSDVRSPHNYFVNTWARLGLVGLVIVSVIVLYGLWLMVVVKRRSSTLSELDIVAMLCVVGIPAVAAVGVVLESPFGAVPYFWAIGYLGMRASVTEPAPVGDGAASPALGQRHLPLLGRR
jgi:hypothetical protein